eukprot:scaffold781_cov132-Cylindrotheca_fusiformis.AAC.21
MDENNKKRGLEIEVANSPPAESFVYTTETTNADIPKTTLTHLRVDSSVREIPANAFEHCSSLVNVQLPETLTRIGRAAFQSCFKLGSVQFTSTDGSPVETSSLDHQHHLDEPGLIVIPEMALLQIDGNAFQSCHSLRKVVVCSNATKLGAATFRNCAGLRSFQFPKGIQVIEKELFMYCKQLITVNIPSSVIRIGDDAFYGCDNLHPVDFPHGLVEIGRRSFQNCRSIATLEIPSTVSTIGKSAFSGCTGLKNVKLPATLEIVEKHLFAGCLELVYIEVPPTVKKIESCAFESCTSLSHVKIPPSVDTMGRDVFRDCTNLISIELPEGLLLVKHDTNDEDEILITCKSLVNLALPPETEPWVTFGRENGDILLNVKYHSVADSYGDLCYKLKHRFDSCPMNKLCYYQSYYSPEDAMLELNSLMDEDPLAAITQVDEFGMTPLHVLSLSQFPNLKMLLAVMNGGHPDHIVGSRDSFGSTPMDYLCLNKMPNSIQVIRSLLQAAIGKRLDWLGLDQWKLDILQSVDEAMAVDWSSRRREIGAVYFKLENYERKEVLSLLELFLWKVKIDQICPKTTADRQSCRINSGASIVIPIVLPFLGKFTWETIFPIATVGRLSAGNDCRENGNGI